MLTYAGVRIRVLPWLGGINGTAMLVYSDNRIMPKRNNNTPPLPDAWNL